MKTTATLSAAFVFCATMGAAQDQHFLCISEIDGSEMMLVKPASGNDGEMKSQNINGPAKVFPGLGNVTFMYADENTVVTLFVKHADLTYNLSMRRPTISSDRGQCEAVAS